MKLLATRVEAFPDRRAGSATLSLLLHFTALALLLTLPNAPLELTEGKGGLVGPSDGGGGGGGGGEVVQYISIARAAPPPPAPPVPEVVEPEPELEPVIQPTLPEPEVVAMVDSMPETASPTAAADTTTGTATTGVGLGSGTGVGPGSEAGSGGGSGGGIGTGIGTGRGPGMGGGDGTAGRAPSPRMLLLPPTAPKEMRGRSVAVQLAVDSAGVVRDVTLVPETGNGSFDDAIRRTALAWRFHPGTDGTGRLVAKAFEVVLTF